MGISTPGPLAATAAPDDAPADTEGPLLSVASGQADLPAATGRPRAYGGDLTDVLGMLRRQLVAERKTSKWDEVQKLASLSAALGAPTRTGAFGETMANVGKVLGEYAAQRNEADQTRLGQLLKYAELEGTLGTKKGFTIDSLGRAWDLTGTAPRLMTDVMGRSLVGGAGAPTTAAPARAGEPQPDEFGMTQYTGAQYNAKFGTKFPADATITRDQRGRPEVLYAGTRGTERTTIVGAGGDKTIVERPKDAPAGTPFKAVTSDVPAGSTSFTGYDPSLTGPALYAEIQRRDPSRAKLIDDIHEGRVPPPTTGTRSKEGEKLLSLVAGVYPDFDAGVAKTRFATRTAYSPAGKVGQNIASFNTAIQHLNEFNDAAENLHNVGFMPANRVKNFVAENFDNSAVSKFKVTRKAVVDELTRAFRMAGGNVHDIKAWEDAVNAAAGPQQLTAIVNTAAQLLGDRLDALVDPYNKAMGENRTFLSWMPPKSREAYLKLNPSYQLTDDDKKFLAEEELNARSKKGAPATGAAPAGASGKDVPPVSMLKEGVHTTFKNGQVWTLVAGKPKRIG